MITQMAHLQMLAILERLVNLAVSSSWTMGPSSRIRMILEETGPMTRRIPWDLEANLRAGVNVLEVRNGFGARILRVA
jgi:hypothetical protein